MNIVPRKDPMQASSSSLRPPSFGSSNTHGRLSGVHSTSWHSQWPALFIVLVSLAAFPVTVSAAPLTFRLGINLGANGIYPRGPDSSNSNSSPSNGNISMSVWLPILLVTVVFILFSFCTCVRRCAARDTALTTSANGNRSASAPSGGNATRPRRRPRRTPSQISTKSLPPYMKEPGDQELVLFRGPSEMEDDQGLLHGMPTLAEDDEEHPEMHHAMFDIPLDRIESFDTMADSSSTNLIRRVSASVPRPPELHHSAMPHDHRRSVDGHSLSSVGSEAELLALGISADPRGEAPSYAEAVSALEGTMTISLNDPEPNHASSSPAVPPLSHTVDSSPAGRGRPRFNFLVHNLFGSQHSHNHTGGTPPTTNEQATLVRSESRSPVQHIRTGSRLSRFSSRESHETHHSRTPSRNNLRRSQSRSNSNLFRTYRAHPPGVHAGSSMISLDSISAPLTHTATRAEFHAPKGGLLTPEQIKLITSREALERFGVPYGPDAVAFSMSKERLAEIGPPPDFESATGAHQEQSGASGSGNEAAEGAVEMTVQGSGVSDPASDTALSRSTSLSPSRHASLSHRPDERAASRASTVISYATAHESDEEGHGQTVDAYASDSENEGGGPDEPLTARPISPTTARPLDLSGGSVVRRS